MSPTQAVTERGQSLWLDFIRRSLLTSGDLQDLIDEANLRGMTSNPAIFQKAIAGSDEYDDDIRAALAADPRLDTKTLFETIAVEDIRRAADILRPVYDETDGKDGYVSLEVAPGLAHDTPGTIEEARRLWKTVDRPNLMIKVPATPEGIPAIETLLAEGINVNVTLMFSLGHYEDVAQAYLRGANRAERPERLHSVASFFISRVDAMVDPMLDEIGTPEALALRGRIGIANAKMAYQRFREIFHGAPFDSLHRRDGNVQRPLWASTSTKDPAYPDVLYVEALIGPDTVNTLPPETLEAFRDHGEVHGATIEADVVEARQALERLADLGIDLDDVTDRLQTEGVEKFAKPFDALMESLDEKRAEIEADLADRLDLNLNGYADAVDARLATWQTGDLAGRIWKKDPTVWSEEPKAELGDRLGWLDLPRSMHAQLDDIRTFVEGVRVDGIEDVVVLGMGGSSLAPDVFARTFRSRDGYPDLQVLDSTHPDAVRAVGDDVDLDKTLFVVSSKSGTTMETLSFFRYFWAKLDGLVESPGRHFVAVTDPGTPLAHLAHRRGFRKLFLAPNDIGGRYSALSVFGLVPAALMGVDVHLLLDRAGLQAGASDGDTYAAENTPLVLGAALGELARAGRDKTTFLTSPSLDAFPAWLEQLIAESTGKDDTGVVPVADEPLSNADHYGDDRFFVYFELEDDDPDDAVGAKLDALEAAGHPVARIRLNDRADLAAEMFRWELAVAASGAALDIHPFDQPNVESAKRLAREAMKNGDDDDSGAVEEVSVHDARALPDAVADWLESAEAGDYIGIHAYLAPTPETTRALQRIRTTLRDRTNLATTLGYGPRFLHSTGQLHKGGPNSGLFLQFVDAPGEALPVPETDYTFRQLIRAQAIGDYQALVERDRRVLRVQLGQDALAGLEKFVNAL